MCSCCMPSSCASLSWSSSTFLPLSICPCVRRSEMFSFWITSRLDLLLTIPIRFIFFPQKILFFLKPPCPTSCVHSSVSVDEVEDSVLCPGFRIITHLSLAVFALTGLSHLSSIACLNWIYMGSVRIAIYTGKRGKMLNETIQMHHIYTLSSGLP